MRISCTIVSRDLTKICNTREYEIRRITLIMFVFYYNLLGSTDKNNNNIKRQHIHNNYYYYE